MKKLFGLLALLMLMSVAYAEPHVGKENGPIVNCFADGCTVSVTLRNTGTDMDRAWIMELQPRPMGVGPLSISQQNTCDQLHPENVHREFYISAGDSETITLSTKVNPGDYDLYLLPRDRCWAWFQGNSIVPIYKSPYSSETWGSYYLIGTFHVGGTQQTTTSTTTTTLSTTTTTPGGSGGNNGGIPNTVIILIVVAVGIYLVVKK